MTERVSIERRTAFSGHGREVLTPQEQQIRDLENKLIDVEMKRDILKRAMAIFSRSPNVLDLFPGKVVASRP